jgi:hypothetical protein
LLILFIRAPHTNGIVANQSRRIQATPKHLLPLSRPFRDLARPENCRP